MAHDIWEEVVARFLTQKHNFFVRLNHRLISPDNWNAEFDILALDFLQSTVWMVEVTTSKIANIKRKAVDFDNYARRLLSQLDQMSVPRPLSGQWTVKLWAIAHEDHSEEVAIFLEKTLRPNQYRETDLQNVIRETLA